jgi:hypothetical protein
MALGWVMVAEVVPVHPLTSVMLHVYVPAGNDPNVALEPAMGDQLYE